MLTGFFSHKRNKIEISDHLQRYDRVKNSGTCIACQKTVQWAMARVAAHKRTSCPNASEEEKRRFSKRNADNLNTSSDSISTENDQPLETGINMTRWFSVFSSMNDLLASKYVLIQLADEEFEILKDI